MAIGFFQVIILAWVIPPVFVQASFEAVDVWGINNIIRQAIPYAGDTKGKELLAAIEVCCSPLK